MKTHRTETVLIKHAETQPYTPNSIQMIRNDHMGFVYKRNHNTGISEGHYHGQEFQTNSNVIFTKMTENDAAVDSWANKNNPNGWTISNKITWNF